MDKETVHSQKMISQRVILVFKGEEKLLFLKW